MLDNSYSLHAKHRYAVVSAIVPIGRGISQDFMKILLSCLIYRAAKYIFSQVCSESFEKNSVYFCAFQPAASRKSVYSVPLRLKTLGINALLY